MILHISLLFCEQRTRHSFFFFLSCVIRLFFLGLIPQQPSPPLCFSCNYSPPFTRTHVQQRRKRDEPTPRLHFNFLHIPTHRRAFGINEYAFLSSPPGNNNLFSRMCGRQGGGQISIYHCSSSSSSSSSSPKEMNCD